MRALPNATRAWLLQRLPWSHACELHDGLLLIPGMTSAFSLSALQRNPDATYERCAELLRRMQGRGLLTVIHFQTAAVTARNQAHWQAVPQLLEMLKQEGLEADVQLYGTLMNILRKSGQADLALRLLSEMEAQSLAGDQWLHGDALNAVAATGDAAATLALLPRLTHPYPDHLAFNQVPSFSYYLIDACISPWHVHV
jgi:pentatricopeptide repeat protein